jgi:hypothetical protein
VVPTRSLVVRATTAVATMSGEGRNPRVEAAGLGQLCLGDDLVDATVQVLPVRRIRDGAVEAEFHDIPLGGLPAMRSMRAHWASVTGITDSRAMRTSGKSLKSASALISASVTALGNRWTGATSTATY